jgi:hypothetical protein
LRIAGKALLHDGLEDVQQRLDGGPRRLVQLRSLKTLQPASATVPTKSRTNS